MSTETREERRLCLNQDICDRIHNIAWKSLGRDESDEPRGPHKSREAWDMAKRAVLQDEVRACDSFEELRDLLAEIVGGEFDDLWNSFQA